MSCAIGTKKWCESNNLCFDGWRWVGNEREKGRGFTLVLVHAYSFIYFSIKGEGNLEGLEGIWIERPVLLNGKTKLYIYKKRKKKKEKRSF